MNKAKTLETFNDKAARASAYRKTDLAKIYEDLAPRFEKDGSFNISHWTTAKGQLTILICSKKPGGHSMQLQDNGDGTMLYNGVKNITNKKAIAKLGKYFGTYSNEGCAAAPGL